MKHCLLVMEWPMHTSAHSCYDFLHKTCTRSKPPEFQQGWRGASLHSYLRRDWQLVVPESPFSFIMCLPLGCPCHSGCQHSHLHMVRIIEARGLMKIIVNKRDMKSGKDGFPTSGSWRGLLDIKIHCICE